MLEEKDIKKLNKYGIINIKKVDTLSMNKICAKLSKYLEDTLKTHNLNLEDLFIKLSRMNMFFADFNEVNVKAKYIPEYMGIFIKEDTDIENLDSSVMHEALHYIQSQFDDKNNLVSMGLIKKVKFKKQKNIALNEAATQTLASIALNEKPSSSLYFDISFIAPSKDYYPIETALIKQMMFFTGSYPLYNSTIYGNTLFEDTFKTITSENVFDFISDEMENLIFYQDEISKLYQKQTSKIPTFLKNYIKKRIDIIKINIQNTALNIQDAIYQNSFNNQINKIQTMEDCKDIRARLESFSNILLQKDDDFSYSNYMNFAEFMIAEKEKQLKLYNVVLNDDLIIKEESYLPSKNSPMFLIRSLINKFKLFLEVSFKKRLLGNDI